MCRAPEALKTTTKKERRSWWPLLALVPLWYFSPWAWHEAEKLDTSRGLISTPASAMRLEVLESTTTKLRWKRDGGLAVESELIMRIHNDLIAPLKVRSINMTAAFPMLGGGNYKAGFQLISGFAAGPKGSSTMHVRYVLNDLRLSMLGAVMKNFLANVWHGSSTALETKSTGRVFLWPTGSLPLRCSMTIPFQSPSLPLHVVNTCQAPLLN